MCVVLGETNLARHIDFAQCRLRSADNPGLSSTIPRHAPCGSPSLWPASLFETAIDCFNMAVSIPTRGRVAPMACMASMTCMALGSLGPGGASLRPCGPGGKAKVKSKKAKVWYPPAADGRESLQGIGEPRPVQASSLIRTDHGVMPSGWIRRGRTDLQVRDDLCGSTESTMQPEGLEGRSASAAQAN